MFTITVDIKSLLIASACLIIGLIIDGIIGIKFWDFFCNSSDVIESIIKFIVFIVCMLIPPAFVTFLFYLLI